MKPSSSVMSTRDTPSPRHRPHPASAGRAAELESHTQGHPLSLTGSGGTQWVSKPASQADLPAASHGRSSLLRHLCSAAVNPTASSGSMAHADDCFPPGAAARRVNKRKSPVKSILSPAYNTAFLPRKLLRGSGGLRLPCSPRVPGNAASCARCRAGLGSPDLATGLLSLLACGPRTLPPPVGLGAEAAGWGQLESLSGLLASADPPPEPCSVLFR